MNKAGWRREALSLPLVLVVLAFGMAFVGVAFYLAENYQVTSRSVDLSQRLYNVAQEGLERGKIWIDVSLSRGVYPRWSDEDGDGLLEASDLSGGSLVELLTAWGEGPSGREKGHWKETIDDIVVEVRVFDTALEVEEGLYDPLVPPLLQESTTEMERAKLSQSYASANQSEGSFGGGMTGSAAGFYVIRSTASQDGRQRSLEAAVAVR